MAMVPRRAPNATMGRFFLLKEERHKASVNCVPRALTPTCKDSRAVLRVWQGNLTTIREVCRRHFVAPASLVSSAIQAPLHAHLAPRERTLPLGRRLKMPVTRAPPVLTTITKEVTPVAHVRAAPSLLSSAQRPEMFAKSAKQGNTRILRELSANPVLSAQSQSTLVLPQLVCAPAAEAVAIRMN